MTNQQPAKLSQPSIGSFNDPATFVAAEFAPVFISPLLVILPIGHNQFYASLLQALAQRVRVIAAVGDHAHGLFPRRADRLWHPDLRQRGFRKCNFSRRGTFQPNSQRNTFTVCQYHPLRPLAALGFTDGSAPFFAGAKLPSKKVSSHSSRPSPSRAPSRTRQAASHTPTSCHCWSRRQQVAGEGNSSGKNRHAAPVYRIHRIPSKQPRLGAGGRPRLSLRGLGFGSKGSTNSHCSSVNSFCRFFMTEAHQLTCLRRKYLI